MLFPFPPHLILIDGPLRQQIFVPDVVGFERLFVVIAIFGLKRVRGEKDGSLGRAVNVHVQNPLLDLEEEEMLGDFLE